MTEPMSDLPDSVTGGNEDPPMVVNASALPDMLWAGVRQAAPPIMAFLIGRNLIANDVALMLGVLGAIVWPIVAGQLKTRHRATQLGNLGKDRRVSDTIIMTKSAAG